MKKVVVIGAGILGASTAYHLAKEGAEVTIVDRNDIGRATDAAAGIIGPWLAQRRNMAWYNLARSGARFYPEIIKELAHQGEENTGYSRVGLIALHRSEERLLAAEERAYTRKEDAPEIGEIKKLSPEETVEMVPLLREDCHSIYVSGAARVDGNAVRNALLRASEKLGAKLVQGNASLIVEQQKNIGVQVDGEKIHADAVVAATGAWLDDLLKPLDMKLGAYPQKAQIIHLEASHINMDNWPVIMPPNNQYILPFDDRIIIGATHESAAGFNPNITAGGVHEVLSKAIEVAPELADLELKEIKVGYRPFIPGSLPIIGELPNYKGLFLANGLGASGLTIGPYVGRELALIALGKNSELNLADYQMNIL